MRSLADLQREIDAIRSERGFTKDPLRVYALLNEEIGEVAHELKKAWSPNYGAQRHEQLADELADCFVALCALASAHSIDLSAAVERKFFAKDGQRVWTSSSASRGSMTPARNLPPSNSAQEPTAPLAALGHAAAQGPSR